VTYSSEVRNVPDVRNFVYPNWDPSEPPLVADYLVGGTRVNRMRRLSHSRFCKQHRDRCSKRAQRSGVPLTGLPGPAARRRWRTAYPGVRNPASFSFLAAWATEGSTYREQTRANGGTASQFRGRFERVRLQLVDQNQRWSDLEEPGDLAGVPKIINTPVRRPAYGGPVGDITRTCSRPRCWVSVAPAVRANRAEERGRRNARLGRSFR
jgi:hypothetical protein